MYLDEERWFTVATKASLSPGNVLGVRVGELDIALYNIDGEYFSTHDICTHALAYMSQGWLEGGEIECPLHGGRFEVKTGKGLGPPITCDLVTLPTRVVGDDIQVYVA